MCELKVALRLLEAGAIAQLLMKPRRTVDWACVTSARRFREIQATASMSDSHVRCTPFWAVLVEPTAGSGSNRD